MKILNMEKPEHKHIIIRAEVNDPPQEKDGESLATWIGINIQITIDIK